MLATILNDVNFPHAEILKDNVLHWERSFAF